MSQCWPRPSSPYAISRPKWIMDHMTELGQNLTNSDCRCGSLIQNIQENTISLTKKYIHVGGFHVSLYADLWYQYLLLCMRKWMHSGLVCIDRKQFITFLYNTFLICPEALVCWNNTLGRVFSGCYQRTLCLNQWTAGNAWVHTQHCGYWCHGAEATGHQYL